MRAMILLVLSVVCASGCEGEAGLAGAWDVTSYRGDVFSILEIEEDDEGIYSGQWRFSYATVAVAVEQAGGVFSVEGVMNVGVIYTASIEEIQLGVDEDSFTGTSHAYDQSGQDVYPAFEVKARRRP